MILAYLGSLSAYGATVDCKLNGPVDPEYLRLNAPEAYVNAGVAGMAKTSFQLLDTEDPITYKKITKLVFDGRDYSENIHGLFIPYRFELVPFKKWEHLGDTNSYLEMRNLDRLGEKVGILMLDPADGTKATYYSKRTKGAGQFSHGEFPVTIMYEQFDCKIDLDK